MLSSPRMTAVRAWAISLLLGCIAHAQIFKVQGGTSTLLNADGVSMGIKAPNYESSFGGGFLQGKFELGAMLRHEYRGYTLLAGDDSVPFQLPTDLFDSSHYFAARGIGVSRATKTDGFYALVGTTATPLGTGFFQAANSEDPVAVLFFERHLRKDLRLVSRNILSNRQTSLQGLEWQPHKWLKASISEGIGSNQTYTASGLDVETSNLIVRANYVAAGSRFRRVTVPSLLSSEVDKGNVEVIYKPNSTFGVTAAHNNLLQPLDLKSPMARASVNELVSDFHVGRAYFGAGLFASTTANRSTTGTNLYAGRRFRERWEVTGNYFDSRSGRGPSTTILSATLRESLSQRFSILQLITRSNGQTTAAFGGDFISNRMNLRVDYQNVYVPFRPDRPFQQALAVNAAIRLAGPLQITAASNVAPDGHLRFTLGATTYLYRLGGMFAAPGQSAETFSLPKCVVEGTVKDEAGNPVEGAALRINGQAAFTDSEGRFLIRFRKHGPFSFQVAVDEFLTPGLFQTVDAPGSVRAETEAQSKDVVVIVRRLGTKS